MNAPEYRHGNAIIDPHIMRMTRFLALFVIAFGLAGASATIAAPPSASDKADIARAEEYLNGMKSLRARFAQDSSRGGFAEGKVYLRRPGKLRLDYAPPATIQVYADGIWLIYVDTELEEVTHVPLNSTLAGVLVRKDISLSGEVTVTKVQRGSGILRVHLVQTKEPEAGSLVLNFTEKPFALRSWTVTDAQGVTTRVTLIGAETNVTIANDIFRFDQSKYDSSNP